MQAHTLSRFKITLEKAAVQPWSMFQVSPDVYPHRLCKFHSQATFSQVFSLPQNPDTSLIVPHTDRMVPPSFTRRPKDTVGVLGTSCILESKVAGSSPISVAWFHEKTKIVSGAKYQTTFSDNVCTLQLNSLDLSDTGNYTCVAANVAGSDECRAVLAVQGQWETLTPFPTISSLSAHPG